jgi:hypothetical protein
MVARFRVVQESPERLNIEGIPDAARIIEVEGEKAEKLRQLHLHKSDLETAEAFLDALNRAGEDAVVREALWRSAIVSYVRAFRTCRDRLDPGEVYQHISDAERPVALECHEFFYELRNKHLEHDVSVFTDSFPMAAINDGSKAHKVEKILSMRWAHDVLSQESWQSLKLLIQAAVKWVDQEIDAVTAAITKELEAVPYKELAARPDARVKAPRTTDVGKSRHGRR